MNRKQFISKVASATATTVVGAGMASANSITSPEGSASLIKAINHKVKRGVSLYSYQQAAGSNGMTLEQMLEECASIGAYGIECIGQVFIKDYPNPSEKWFEEWWELHDKYGTKPVCYTNFNDFELQKDPLRIDENIEYNTREFKLARRMGLTKIRAQGRTPAPLVEAQIPVAEKLGVQLCFEIHSPTPITGRWIEWLVGKAEKHPETVALMPDMGIFQKYPRPYARERQIKNGTLTREIALLIEDSYKKGMDKAEIAAKVKGMKPKPGDTGYVDSVYRIGENCQNPKDLIPIMKYCKHMHAKMYEMTKGDEYNDATILYNEVIPLLMEHGFDGYVCTEYEGQRSMEIADVNEIDEVRRQHLMLKRMLGV